jgi:DNA polymerase III epsilon subunit-like protein
MIEQLLPELAGRVIVAHAVSIERGFLATLLRRMGGVPLPNPFVDTMALERHLIEGHGGRVRELHGDLTLTPVASACLPTTSGIRPATRSHPRSCAGAACGLAVRRTRLRELG